MVTKIVEGIRSSAKDLQGLKLGCGTINRIAGASGYRHQIDVSLFGNAHIFIIECKRWNRRAGVHEVLVLAGRAQDIRDAHPGASVIPILVSTQGASRNAKRVAEHFGIAIEIAKSPSEYGLRIGRQVREALSMKVCAGFTCKATVTRDGVIIDE